MRWTEGIIPAYAGSTPAVARRWPSAWDHPRIRGEHWRRRHGRLPTEGSSPHTRGALVAYHQSPRRARIIPAYAGSTPRTCPPAGRPGDHPRIRGEHFMPSWRRGDFGGSSPHTRGALLVMMVRSVIRGIIPAYAGSTAAFPRRVWQSTDHPRIRGEHE